MVTDDEIITLDIHCTRCGGALEMETGEPTTDVQPWTCPYCGHAYAWTPGYRILWVVKRAPSAAAH